TVPSYEDLISGRLELTTIRHVELDALLGRDPVVLDNAGLAEWLGNRVVMVTGAGGSIGAELARQIARFHPARLVLFDLSEAALYEICTALGDAFPQLPLAAVVGDVKHASPLADRPARDKLSAPSDAPLSTTGTALADASPQLPLAAVVGDVKHASLVDDVLAREKPSV